MSDLKIKLTCGLLMLAAPAMAITIQLQSIGTGCFPTGKVESCVVGLAWLGDSVATGDGIPFDVAADAVVPIAHVGFGAFSAPGTTGTFSVMLPIQLISHGSQIESIMVGFEDSIAGGLHSLSITSSTAAVVGPIPVLSTRADYSKFENVSISMATGHVVTLADGEIAGTAPYASIVVPLMANVQVSEFEVFTGVPEPAGWWMMGAGLMLVGLKRGNRRR